MHKTDPSESVPGLTDEAGLNVLRRSATVLFKMVPNVAPIGSAFFLGAKSGIYVVSAAHVLRECFIEHPRQIAGSHAFFGLNELNFCDVVGTRNICGPDDPLDIGVVRLEGARARDAASPRATLCTVYDLEVARQNLLAKSEVFAIVGTPLNRSKTSAQQRETHLYPVHLLTPPASEESANALALDQSTHFAISYDPKEVNEGGYRIPKPTGMSGGPVWGANRTPAGRWVWSLQGIGIEQHANLKAMLCTRLAEAVRMIDDLSA